MVYVDDATFSLDVKGPSTMRNELTIYHFVYMIMALFRISPVPTQYAHKLTSSITKWEIGHGPIIAPDLS